MLILAHRGESGDAPENTLAAFRLAVERGADGVELDVQRCRSGQVVVCHDGWLTRLAEVELEVTDTSWDTLRRLDVGTPLGFGKERIPLLEEVLQALPPGLLVNVELKCEAVDDGGLTRATVEVIRQAGAEQRVLVSSFNPFCLWRLMEHAPELRRGYLLDPERSLALHGRVVAPLLRPYSLHPHFSQLTMARVLGWKAAGWKLAAWTVDLPGEAKRLLDLGVDFLITNRSGALRRELTGLP